MANRDERLARPTQAASSMIEDNAKARQARERDEAEGGHRDREYSNADWARAREQTDPERRRRIREILNEAALPNLPRKPGFHRCWVSTTSSTDTVQRRRRLGYDFVKYEDIAEQGWTADADRVVDGRFAGSVMWRELIAMEIPADLHHDIMRELHHDRPREQALGIFEPLEETAGDVRQKGGRIEFAEGFEDMRRYVRPPSQFES